MMTKCPECGSTEIIPDLIMFGGYPSYPVFFNMVDPKRKGEGVTVGPRVAVCGACGHIEMYTKYAQDLLDAHKKGYVTQEPNS